MRLTDENKESDITDLSENGYTCFMTHEMSNGLHHTFIILVNVNDQKCP